MILKDIKELIKVFPFGKCLLALDVSKNHLGIAKSNTDLTIALPLYTINRTNFTSDLAKILTLYKEESAGALIAGYPIELSGIEGSRCQSVLDFLKLCLHYQDLPIFLQDERFSSRAIKKSFATIKKKVTIVDEFAAAWFLQITLDTIKYLQKG